MKKAIGSVPGAVGGDGGVVEEARRGEERKA